MDSDHLDEARALLGSCLHASREGTCLGSTCMKWGGDGELAPQDLQAILARLSEVDGEASGLMECPVDPS